MIFGSSGIAIDTSFGSVTADHEYFEMKSTMNNEDIVLGKYIDGGRKKLRTTFSHTYVIDFFRINKEQLTIIQSAMLNNEEVSFYQHSDNTWTPMSAQITKCSPYYNQGFFGDGYDAAIVEIKSINSEHTKTYHPRYMSEAWHLGGTGEYNTFGVCNKTFTITGSSSSESGGMFGTQCLRFPAGLNYLSFPNYETGNDWTLSFWVKIPLDTDGGHIMTIGDATTGTSQIFTLYKGTQDALSILWLPAIRGINGDVFNTVNTGDPWHHIMVKHDSGIVYFFMDGVLRQTETSNSNSDAKIYLGYSPWNSGNRPFLIYLDEVFLQKSPVELTHADVAYWYNEGAGVPFREAKWYYPMEMGL
jgi:hypothetical protein